MKVEQAYGVLNGCWHILDYIQECNISFISKIMFACCVLHNFCILAGEEWDNENANDFDNGDQADDGNILRDGDEIWEVLNL